MKPSMKSNAKIAEAAAGNGFKTATSEKVVSEASHEPHPILLRYATWDEDYRDPDPTSHFPLREIAQDATAFLARAGHFSQRDINFLVKRLGFQVDPKNHTAFYDAILDIAEGKAWIIPMIEVEVVRNRRGIKHGAASYRDTVQKKARIIGKLPLMKLRLEGNSHLEGRVGDFLVNAKPSTDLVVGAFCEYAVDHYTQVTETSSKEEFFDMFTRAIGEAGPENIFDHLFKLAEDSGYWDSVIEVLDTRISTHLETGEDPTGNLRADIVKTLKALVETLDEQSDSEDFTAIAMLSEHAAGIADGTQSERADEIVASFESIGIVFDEEDLTEARIARLSTRDITELTLEVADVREDHAANIIRSQEIDALIADATRMKRYDELGRLAGEGEKLDAINKERDRRHGHLQDIVTAILTDDAAALEDLLPGQIPHGETTHEDAPDAQVLPEDDLQGVIQDAETAEPAPMPETGPGETQDDIPQTEPEDIPEEVVTPSGISVLPEPDSVEGPVAQVPSETLTDEMPARDISTSTPARTETKLDNRTAETPTADKDQDVSEDTTGDALDDALPSAEPPLDAALLGHLIDRNLLGIAADAAGALEAKNFTWPVEAAALRAAAASRAQHGDYGPDTQRFLTLANRAATVVQTDMGRNILLGALLRPAILQQSFSLRTLLPDLARGTLGARLREVAEAIADLEYDFPPGSDTLARLSGTRLVPQRKRIVDRLEEWCAIMSRKSSRWSFATLFMHHVVSDSGLIGQALAAIKAGQANAPELAHRAIDQLSTAAEIEDRGTEFASTIGRSSARLHPKGVEYLYRHFDEAIGILSAWITAFERESTQNQRSEERMRIIVGNLTSRLEKAQKGLSGDTSGPPISRAVSSWLVRRIKEASKALKGSDTGDFLTIEEALKSERDLLSNMARRSVSEEEAQLNALITVFEGDGIPEPKTAFEQACKEGSFEVAGRLAERFNLDEDGKIDSDIAAFTTVWSGEISSRLSRMKALSKVDYSHQEDIVRRLDWCESALERIKSAADGKGTDDLDDIPLYAEDLDRVSSEIEVSIRADQKDRIQKYRSEQNHEDADALHAASGTLTLEAVEDRIAQLRDGRSAATFETEIDGLVADFTPDFVTEACGPDWPRTAKTFSQALEKEGPLFTDESRRSAAREFFELYKSICEGLPKGKPSATKIKAFLEEVGFENVRVSGVVAAGRAASWKMTVTGDLNHTGWFLPPAFGSKVLNGYTLLLVGPDMLPEMVQKALDRETPTILLLSGVADLARRRDFAETLRANAIPAILLDEALVAFAATRRNTRAHTIFECGLPYGRVEPYTTDAGNVAEEMFFGREAEIRDIMSRTADGCLVYGGRQLGKSALLTHVAHTHHAPEEDRIVVRREVKPLGNAESTSEVWSHLNAMLVPEGIVNPASRDADTVIHDIRAWLSTRPGGQIICLFDETDHFMAADTKDDYPQISRLKDLMEITGRSFKVVFAGLHNVQRMHRQPNSPLAHLGRAICIGPLNRTEDDKRAAHDLVILPMRAAGYRFESIEAVEEILAWANYYPSLVQEYARGLLSTLHGLGSGKTYRLPEDGPLWTIPTSELFDHRGFHQIESRVREKFHLTLELDPRYALVAYTLAWLNIEGYEHQALVSGFRAGDLLEHTQKFWPKTAEKPSQAAFDALLDELFDLGVLGRVQIPETKRYTYCLRTRQVAAMLGSSEDIMHALLELEEKDPTVAYDRTIHRRRYAPPGKSISVAQRDLPYAPLTDFQIERILDRDGKPVQIICGLDILGLHRIGTALKRISETGPLPGAGKGGIELVLTETDKDIRMIFKKSHKSDLKRTVLIHKSASAAKAAKELSWLERQKEVLDGHIRPIILLDAAVPEMRALAIRRSDQSEFLGAWGAEMVRVHLSNIERSELDVAKMRDRILAATGGVPSDIVKLVSALHQSSSSEDVFMTWEPSLKASDPIVKGLLGQVLVMIEETTSLGDYEALDDMVRETFGADLVTFGPDLSATGLITTWAAKTGRISKSALGHLVTRMLDG